ncbi:MAG: NRDE family protein [Acetobacteraceae bacterium]|nr:NRDE family protein [Acetobacteraceae bacterium]
MCTVILLRRPGRPWPLLIAANRDERVDRAWDPPGWHWPHAFGGRDATAGGTWMAMNRAGVVAAVLNRPGSLGPEPGKRSRGELPLLLSEADTARSAVARLHSLDAGDWRPFNLVIADGTDGFFAAGFGAGAALTEPLEDGISMVTAHPPNDLGSPRTARHLPRFRAAPAPEPDRGDWGRWEALLADSGGSTAEALNVPPLGGFGTVCSSLIGLAADGRRAWRFAPGPPDRTPFRELDWDRVA